MTGRILLAVLVIGIALFAVWVVERHTPWSQYQAGAKRASDGESRWPRLVVEDFTESDEIAPPRVKAHVECFDLWVDGKRPCGRCAEIFEVKA